MSQNAVHQIYTISHKSLTEVLSISKNLFLILNLRRILLRKISFTILLLFCFAIEQSNPEMNLKKKKVSRLFSYVLPLIRSV